MAVDEDHTTIQEQPEQDGTQKNQQQQKEEEEDSEEEDSEDEEQDSEYLYELLGPFKKRQLRDLSKQAIHKHPDLAKYWRNYEAFQKAIGHDRENDSEEELFDNLGAWSLEEEFMKKCVSKFQDIHDIVRKQADMNPSHRKILVWSHGFGWDATRESLISEFEKFGEIEDCEYVTDKHSGKFKCCAFILFKHWNGALNALEQPLKKIGNRRAVCNLASTGVHVCRYLNDNPGLPQQRVQAPSLSELFLPPSLIKAPVTCHNKSVMNIVGEKCCCWSSHSLHGSLDHFLEMDRVRKMEEKPDAISNAVVSYNPLVDPTVSKQFEWVCKSSSQLLEKPPINSKHTSLLLKVRLLYSLSCEKFEIGARLNFPPQFPKAKFRFMGSSVNGILYLCSGNKVVLWNPSTKEIKIVPPSPVEFESPYREPQMDYHGFGYDRAGHDYKVIRYVEFFEARFAPYSKNVSLEPLWEIYSLRRDSWKELSYKMPSRYLSLHCPGLCTGGVCHWLGEENKSLVSFDLSKEMFLETPIPSYTCGVEVEMRLTEINGYVALISNYQAKNTIEVSILDKFGVNGSWTKLFDIGPLPRAMNLSGVGKDGYIFLYNEDDGLAYFDFSTLLIVQLGLKRRCEVVTYKDNLESLISFGFEKYDDDEDIVNEEGQSGKITKAYERGNCRKVQKEDSTDINLCSETEIGIVVSRIE